jgi:hypothetical protein
LGLFLCRSGTNLSLHFVSNRTKSPQIAICEPDALQCEGFHERNYCSASAWRLIEELQSVNPKGAIGAPRVAIGNRAAPDISGLRLIRRVRVGNFRYAIGEQKMVIFHPYRQSGH